MAGLADRHVDRVKMFSHIEQVLRRGRWHDPPAYTLVLGAGASFGAVPTVRQMFGLQENGTIHPQCIPAWVYQLDYRRTLPSEELPGCVLNFWRAFAIANPKLLNGKAFPDDVALGAAMKSLFPCAKSIAEGYQLLFDQRATGGLNSPSSARDYLRYVTFPVDGRIKLNSTHFFLASLLALQNRAHVPETSSASPYVGKRPFARTIFTTNFDPLLQVSFQLFQLLYYMTDRPDLLAADAVNTDDNPALHIFYAHGSVHRPFLANSEIEITHLKDRNARSLTGYFARHGVIVLGYSGWDDCLLKALDETTNFS